MLLNSWRGMAKLTIGHGYVGQHIASFGLLHIGFGNYFVLKLLDMQTQHDLNYNRIATAIEYIHLHFKEQPSLEKVANIVGVSPFHFQKLFTDWAGISPKKFLQYTTVQYTKSLLKNKEANLFDAAFEAGLSGTSRLHDLFVTIEAMTPGEYKNGGENLTINYCFSPTKFGEVLMASTAKGICYIAFCNHPKDGLIQLQQQFPNGVFTHTIDAFLQNTIPIFTQDWSQQPQIKLHLKATPFQLKVWETLLKIPMGHLSTYGKIAETIHSPQASRAVGTAIGSNPIAYLIPCHRVIQATGMVGGYMWGSTRKLAIIGWEAALAHRHYAGV